MSGNAGETPPVRVRSDVLGRQAALTLDSPHNRNALSTELLRQLDAALAAVLSDPAVRVVTLTGTGTVFCAGADLKGNRNSSDRSSEIFSSVLRRIHHAGKPVVCHLNGSARAGGIGLMAACHLVVAPLSATFAFTEVRLGVAPAVISVPVLERVAMPAARKLLLTGRTFSAAEAADIGLVDDAVPDGDVAALVRGYANDTALAAPGALAATMGLLNTVRSTGYDEALEEMARLSARLFDSDEAREGIAAWRDQRAPVWSITPGSR